LAAQYIHSRCLKPLPTRHVTNGNQYLMQILSKRH